MNRSIRTFIAAGAALAAVAALPAAASAEPAVNGVYDVPSKPGHMTVGPDRAVWVVLDGAGANPDLARFAPNGDRTLHDLSGQGITLTPEASITTGPDDNLWVPVGNGVAKIPPGSPATATKATITLLANPRGIAVGADNNLWAISGKTLFRIPPASPGDGNLPGNQFTISPDGVDMDARGLTRGGDGLLYAASKNDGLGRIIALNTNGTVATSYTVGGGPEEIATGPGTQVAYSNPGNVPHQIGRITPGGQPQKSDVPTTDPFGATFGADGAYWFANFFTAGVTRLSTTGDVTRITSGFPAGYGPRYITVGPEATNTLWISLENGVDPGKIVRITGVTPPTGGGGGGGGTTPDTTKPALSKVSLSSATLRAGQVRSLRFTLSEAARVTVRFQRALAGKRKGKACVKPTRALRRAKSCVRYATVATRTVAGTAAANRLAFNAKAGRKAYAPGRYRITLSARDAAGNVSALRTVSFRVLAPRTR